MICIGNTRLQKLAVGNEEVVAAYMGSDDSFDFLPYLFCETYSVALEAIPQLIVDNLESNNEWYTKINS